MARFDGRILARDRVAVSRPGLASGRISRLPKSGNWMIRIKMAFGALVLMSGLYFLGGRSQDTFPCPAVTTYLLIANYG